MSSTQIFSRAEATTPAAVPASLKCSSCASDNRLDRQFCASCGARLWEPCLKCGRTNAAVEKHCGECGANLGDLVREAQAAIRAVFDEAGALAEQADHDRAVEQLQALKIADHTALAPLRNSLAERIDELRHEILRCNRERDEALTKGRALRADYDYEQAALTLESVPEPYRTEELRGMLDDVRARQIEVLTLVAEIRRAVAEKTTDDLLPMVEELLRLKPDHPQARGLAERLRPVAQKRFLSQRDGLLKAATVQLAEHDYASALALLTQIHESASTPKLVKLIADTQAKAAETAWLERDLQEAVILDEHLPVIAERLLKLQPANPAALACSERLRVAKHGWPKPPATSVWGPPLETIRAFHRIDVASLDNATFKAAPDRFAVAAGMALQGLQRAALNVNLVPPEKSSVLSLLKTRKKSATSAWGVDLGRAGIRALRLTVTEDEQIVADAAITVDHPQMLNAPEAHGDAILRQSLDTFCQHAELKSAPLCVGLPAHKVLYRPIALPLVDEKKLAECMKFEVRERIPFPAEHVAWGFQMLGARPTDSERVRECEVALLALKLEEARAIVSQFSSRNLKIELLSSDAAALFNFATFDCELPCSHVPRENVPPAAPRPEKSDDGSGALSEAVTVLLDVGSDTSNLVITNSRSLVIRSIPIGGNSFSTVMVKEFQLTFAQAEKVKRTPIAVRELHKLYAALEPRFRDLDRELHRTIDAFLQVDPARRLARFIVTGGGLKLHAGLRRLWHGE